jgi:Lrp/AsnC family transcriptional regulator
MDKIDKTILREIQADGTLSASALGERIGLSAMPAWRRLRRLTETGVVTRTVALLDRRSLGLSTTAFVMLRTRQHDKSWFKRLNDFVKREPAVMEFHRMSGEIDFMLKVVLRSMDDYKVFYDRLTSAVDLLDVSTAFAFETLKETTALPVE